MIINYLVCRGFFTIPYSCRPVHKHIFHFMFICIGQITVEPVTWVQCKKQRSNLVIVFLVGIIYCPLYNIPLPVKPSTGKRLILSS